MKKGDKVICIEKFSYSLITLGKVYLVGELTMNNKITIDTGERTIGMYYKIVNDAGYYGPYESECFMNLADERRKKLKRIESL